jgi:hypothetical protein
MLKYFCLSLFSLVLLHKATAQVDSCIKSKFMALPSVFHTPETSWGFGATMLGFFCPKDSNTKESNAQIFLDATLLEQLSFQSDFNIFTKKNRLYIKGSHDLSKFPEFYFGIGNDNLLEDRCLIDINYFDFKIGGYLKLKKEVNAGLLIHHQNLNQISKHIVQENLYIDNMGYASTGAGIGLLIDKRNNLMNPSLGHYVELKTTKYWDHTHQSKGFVRASLDARYYHTFHKLILNANLYDVHNNGVVPFRMMPGIGGARFLRGYYAGRFRDNHLTLLQAEVRRTLFWRVGVAAFSGVGQVYSDLNDFGVKRFHYNYGGGLRFQINKDSPANIRLDYGFTKDSQGLYIVFGECF